MIDVDKIQDKIFDISHGLEIPPAAPQEKTQLGSPTLPQNPIEGTMYDDLDIPPITVAPSVQAEIDVVNKAIKEGRDAGKALEEWRKKNGDV